RARSIVQLEGWIWQRIGNAMIDQAGPNRAHDHSLLSAASNNKAADHDIVTGLNKGARGDVTQRRCGWRRDKSIPHRFRGALRAVLVAAAIITASADVDVLSGRQV